MSFRIILYRNLSYLRISVDFYKKDLHIFKNLSASFSKSNITNQSKTKAMKLAGKVALVTGSSRGIGKAIADLFAKEGAFVVITAKDQAKLQKTAKELGDVLFVPADIRKESEVQDVVRRTIEKHGRLDILVNNAGVFPKIKPLHEISEPEWNEVIDVNLTGQFRFTKAAMPHLQKNGGTIINIASNAGLKAYENFDADAYSASKAALVMLTKTWAIEYAKNKIRVNCICPGVVETDMAQEFLATPALREIQNSQYPIGRFGTVDDVAKSALYFASDDSSWVTGAILALDGGESAK
jgi:dihydroanticapsin dehydrogenase